MRRSGPKRERGAALLALLAVIMLGASWFLVSQLNSESGAAAAARKTRNAEVLNRAKQALIGYVAAQAAKSGENNPGSLPCPESPGNFDSPTGQGLVGTNCGSLYTQKVGRFPWKTLGMEQLRDASGESLWYVTSRNWGVDIGARTIINSGTDGQLTLDGVPVVALIIAPGAAFSVSATTAAATTGCTAWNQVRDATGTPDWRNYLECENANSPADSNFVTFKAPVVDPVTNSATPVLNDQVIGITAAEVLGGIEAAIAYRIERDIVPSLKDMYLGTTWGLTGNERMFPYAATFADPSLSATSYQGTSALTQGLLPFNYGEACVPATEPRCLLMAYTPATAPVAYAAGGFGYIQTQTCDWDSTDATAALCSGEYHEDVTLPTETVSAGMRIAMTATITNVAKGWRTLEARVEARDDSLLGPWQVMTPTITTTMNPDGSAAITFGANLPNINLMGWGTYAQYRIRLKVADHRIIATSPRAMDFKWGTSEIRIGQTVTGAVSGAVGRVSKVSTSAGVWDSTTTAQSGQATGTISFYSVSGSFNSDEDMRVAGATVARSTSSDSDTDTDLSWFARNEWFRHVYYAVADTYAWTGSGTCTPSVSCIQVTNMTDATKQRALLVVMGRRFGTQIRPSAALTDYLDSTENRNLDGNFEQLKVGSLSNDRFITISKNP
jgi:hypothetical protein